MEDYYAVNIKCATCMASSDNGILIAYFVHNHVQLLMGVGVIGKPYMYAC